MFIQQIKIKNFGGICFYHADLTQDLNLIDSRYTDEIAAAIHLILCSKSKNPIPEQWIQADTQIAATVCLEDAVYQVCAVPLPGQWQLMATDPTGADITMQYRHTLSHCTEQDDVESFDGQDKGLPLRMYRYWCREENDDLSCKTERLADTKTFLKYLRQYIRDYRPEQIHSQKKYQTIVSPQGAFDVIFPGIEGKIYLSETETRLFRYICFLNLAEFWAGFEKIRDLHHRKKPLMIQNFVEFLDESANISNLITRTQKLQRQIILLTIPLDREIKKKWIGEQNERVQNTEA